MIGADPLRGKAHLLGIILARRKTTKVRPRPAGVGDGVISSSGVIGTSEKLTLNLTLTLTLNLTLTLA